MSRNVRVLNCTPEDVFDVLADGWVYPSWVVGATRMREVDEHWPQRGSRLHHSVGVWPLLINDSTVVERFDPPRTLVMTARGWPIGEARVTIDVKPRGQQTVVRIQEESTTGPGRLMPRALMDALLRWRNTETLHRLAYLAEGRSAARGSSTADRERAEGPEAAGREAAEVPEAAGRAAAGANDTEEALPDPGETS